MYLLLATSAIMAALRFGAFFVLSTFGGSGFATLFDASLGLRPRLAGAFLSGSSSSSTASFSVDFTGFSSFAAALLDEDLTGAAAFFAGVFLAGGAFLAFLAGGA